MAFGTISLPSPPPPRQRWELRPGRMIELARTKSEPGIRLDHGTSGRREGPRPVTPFWGRWWQEMAPSPHEFKST